tara:strand:+ start:144 stop:353 length:210 start_codon:yes stop_codon:yes gene_type:complete
MPVKLRPSQKTFIKAKNKTVTENFYLHTMSKEELITEINKSQAKPKVRQKCRNELDRRGVKIDWVPKEA